MGTINLNISVDFERQECISCGCVFFIPNIMGQQLRKNKNTFYCPSGHTQSYIESESDRLKRQLASKIEENGQLQRRVNELSKPPAKRRAMRKAV